MTISKSIAKWLRQCPYLSLIEDVDTDCLSAELESYGIFKQPSGERESFIDGSSEVTEYYTILTRQSYQLESERVSNQEFMAKVEDWIYQKEIDGELPKIQGIETVEVANSFYLLETENDEGIYQFTIKVVYAK